MVCYGILQTACVLHQHRVCLNSRIGTLTKTNTQHTSPFIISVYKCNSNSIFYKVLSRENQYFFCSATPLITLPTMAFKKFPKFTFGDTKTGSSSPVSGCRALMLGNSTSERTRHK